MSAVTLDLDGLGDELRRPVELCSACDHDIEGHEGILGTRACFWCKCGHRKDGQTPHLHLPWEWGVLWAGDGTLGL